MQRLPETIRQMFHEYDRFGSIYFVLRGKIKTNILHFTGTVRLTLIYYLIQIQIVQNLPETID